MKSKYIIPIFVPHRGCNNMCVFCNQRKISGEINDLTSDDVERIIEEYLKINSDVSYNNIQVAFYGGSFTGIEKEKQIEFLEVTKKYIENKKIESVRLSTRPDYINYEILQYLKEYGVKTIELGVQSLNQNVLDASKRGHSEEVVYSASKAIKEYGFELGLQMMIGLPNSNEELEYETAKKIISLNPNIVRIYPTLVIKDTELAQMYELGVYKPYTIEKSIEICAKLLQCFENHDINVIRIGLQTTDNINEGKDVLAGPFHPSFGELVRQRQIRNVIEDKIKNECIKNDIVIYCNNKDISKIVGNRKCNIKYFKDKFDIKIKVCEANNLRQGEYKIKEEII